MSLPQEIEPAPPTGDISRLAEHLFRHESGKMVSILTGIFGISRMQLAEDVVQEALIRALQTWPYYGVPQNPAAWLMQAAKNLALDVIRREKTFRGKEPEIVATIERSSFGNVDETALRYESEMQDDTLRMMFACSHPEIPQDAQAALALKTLCGFGIAEIGNAFLSSEAAIAKRLTRAKQRIRELKIPFEIPAGDQLSDRLDGVLQALYLLFNEGYKASSGDNLIREDLTNEAIRLTSLLARHPVGNIPRTHALLALMLLNSARLAARTDENGNILRLKEQDRSRWNQDLIERGILHLGKSAAGKELSEYHLQAAIAACHCLASEYDSTDWPRILSLYDQLARLSDSPVVALNRAVAVANVRGSKAGIDAVNAISDRKTLESYYLLYAVLAEFESELGNWRAAAANLRKALELTEMKSERKFLSDRLRECEEHEAVARR